MSYSVSVAPCARRSPDLREFPGSPVGVRLPVRVMHVMFSLHPGGMELGVVKIVNGLDRQRIQSSICSTKPVADGMTALVSPDVPIHELRRREGNDLKLVWDLYRLFRRERPWVVHTHAWGTLLEGLVAARMAGVPCVIHGEHGTLQLRRYQARLQRWGWGRATQVLSVSRRLSERMAAATGFPADRIQTIQNGVDLSRFSPALRDDARQHLGLGPDDLVIGTAGRLVHVKDHASLIEALARLHQTGVPFTALIAGDGPLRGELEARLVTHHLTGHVRLLGRRFDIERIMAALDVFVLSSRSEGLSNTILEAMASGAAIVATDVGGAAELVDEGRTGLLVPCEDPAALAAALAALAGDPVRRRGMAAAARAKAEAEFSLAQMLSHYEALYLEVGAGEARWSTSREAPAR
jgi:sugar transferase (PEP-CTERM/EpsH1 system associated)